MPKYRSAGIEISISTTDLRHSTHRLSLAGGDPTPLDVHKINSLLERAIPLLERPLVDEHNAGPLRFVGSRGDAPFFLMQAVESRSAPGITKTATTSRESGFAMEEMEEIDQERPEGSSAILLSSSFIKSSIKPPQALVITVDLSKCALFTQASLSDKRGVKVEIFYNGEFSSCRFMRSGRAAVAGTSSHPVQRFSGRRIAKEAERPWVLSFETSGRSESPHTRWQAVNAALKREALSRGANKYGEPSRVADYLSSLSEVQLPALKLSPNAAYHPSVGIIDVVISLGSGRKNYDVCSEPLRTMDKRYTQGRSHIQHTHLSTTAHSGVSSTASNAQPSVSTLEEATTTAQDNRPPQVQPSQGVRNATVQNPSIQNDAINQHHHTVFPISNLRSHLTDSQRGGIPAIQGGIPQHAAFYRDINAPNSQTRVGERPLDTDRSWTTPASAMAAYGVTLRPKGPSVGSMPQTQPNPVLPSRSGLTFAPPPTSAQLPPISNFAFPQYRRGPHYPPIAPRPPPPAPWSHPQGAQAIQSIHGIPQIKRVPTYPPSAAQHSYWTPYMTPAPAQAVPRQTARGPGMKTPPAMSMASLPARPTKSASSGLPAVSTPQRGPHGGQMDRDDVFGSPSSQNGSSKPTDFFTKSLGKKAADIAQEQSTGASHARSDSAVMGPPDTVPARETWQPSPMSENCIFTYAKPWMVPLGSEGDKAETAVDLAAREAMMPGMVRTVRKERHGEFEEESILCGVRYIMI